MVSGVAFAFICAGLYLNFKDHFQLNDPATETTAEGHAGQPIEDDPSEEPGDASLMVATGPEDLVKDAQFATNTPVAVEENQPPLANTSLDDYNPSQLWMNETASTASESPQDDSGSNQEHGEQGAYPLPPSTQPDNPPGSETALGNDPWPSTGSANRTEALGSVLDEDFSDQVKQLAKTRQRLEQQVRRGQIPPSERDQILSSKDFNAVIQSIGRRVGEAWHYEGDDYAEQGAILRIELLDNGDIKQSRIDRSSGNELFNQSVLQAASASAPFLEVMDLSTSAQVLLNPFSLTFGNMEAIENYEATWEPAQPIDAPDTDTDIQTSNTAAAGTLSGIKRQMRQHWPEDLGTGLEHDITLQITLAVPMGNVADIVFLRPSNDVDLNDRIYRHIRDMPPFSGISELPLRDQDEVRQFNLYITPDGRLR
ncbi:TonB C-terminal domain-containing protein [Halomonas sp. 86]|uniref:TonB C-terminal domain-containing protein n=1 Tax=unclassified Halomonas TaxID=2609666 RepID=UPI0040334E77